VREFEDRHAPRWVKSGLSVGSGLLLATGFFVGVVLRSVLLGVLLFALGAILFAIRGYLNTGDKAVAGALIFVALVAISIEVIVYSLGP
jgi:mannose/fructose/N-acetylgalactosamine-specific phosphotransferase system component IIC